MLSFCRISVHLSVDLYFHSKKIKKFTFTFVSLDISNLFRFWSIFFSPPNNAAVPSIPEVFSLLRSTSIIQLYMGEARQDTMLPIILDFLFNFRSSFFTKNTMSVKICLYIFMVLAMKPRTANSFMTTSSSIAQGIAAPEMRSIKPAPCLKVLRVCPQDKLSFTSCHH